MKKCKNSIVFPIINAKCGLISGHRVWHKFQYKDKESTVVIRWKGKE